MSKLLAICQLFLLLLCAQQAYSSSKFRGQHKLIRPQEKELDSELDNLMINHLRSTIETQRMSIDIPVLKSDFQNNESEESINSVEEENGPMSLKNLFEKMNETIDQLQQQVEDSKQQYEELMKEQKSLGLLLESIKVTLEKNSKDSTADLRIHDEQLNCLKNCTPVPSDSASCSDMKEAVDGAFVFKLPNSDLAPFYAYCRIMDQTSSWTVIQRREDGSVDFNRGWDDYKRGFGNVYGEYWIGLERLHALTNSRNYELKIYLEDFENSNRYASYSLFKIASENEGYMLTLGTYSGDAKDSFSYHNSMKFTTYDRQNDEQPNNCAQHFKGGWWFKKCYRSHLNGVYYSITEKRTSGGIEWIDWNNESLRRVIMLIRPL